MTTESIVDVTNSNSDFSVYLPWGINSISNFTNDDVEIEIIALQQSIMESEKSERQLLEQRINVLQRLISSSII